MTLERMKLESESYGRSGNIGENFKKLLGAPTLDPLQTLIREAVQNMCDAAKLGQGPEVLFRLRRLSPAQCQFMKDYLLENLPASEKSQAALKSFMNKPEQVVLEICDFNTTGLAGPTRADQIPIGTTSTDYIDFIRNIGTPRDTKGGGGTYGFGKVSLYQASHCSSILVDTQVAGDTEQWRRLTGCHVGKSFNEKFDGMIKRYTGRHWWGVKNGIDDFVEPLCNESAAEFASTLGFPERGSGRSGTSIMILDFDLNEETMDVVGNRIVETLLWHFWPRMMRDVGQERRISFSVEVAGQKLDVPCPEEFPPLDLFCKAMTAIRNGSDPSVQKIKCRRPAKLLGELAVQRGLRGSRIPIVESESLFPDTSHHIAVMRPVELVVRYFEGEPLPDNRAEWAGVFLADQDEDVERAFAESEPPAMMIGLLIICRLGHIKRL